MLLVEIDTGTPCTANTDFNAMIMLPAVFCLSNPVLLSLGGKNNIIK